MQPIEVYKLLPRKNCGKCSSATCMAFAVQYLRRMISLSECPELTTEAVMEIEAKLGSVPSLNDWKENRIKELIDEMKVIDISEIAGNIGAIIDYAWYLSDRADLNRRVDARVYGFATPHGSWV